MPAYRGSDSGEGLNAKGWSDLKRKEFRQNREHVLDTLEAYPPTCENLMLLATFVQLKPVQNLQITVLASWWASARCVSP